MRQIDESDFEINVNEVLERVRASGRPVLVTRSGEPIAQVMSPPPTPVRRTRWLGSMRDSGRVVGDIVGQIEGDEGA